MRKSRILAFLLLAILCGTAGKAFAQAVSVTLGLDTNTVAVGSSTTLRVFAQVVPSLRPNAERIFSWYLDVLNTNGGVAAANYNVMQKTTSDNDVDTSSIGFTDGANRRGIYDTFLNLSGAGVSNRIELMAIPVTGLASGQTRFQVRAGSGVPELAWDFIVAPLTGESFLTGGDYSAASIDLHVSGSCAPRLQLSSLTPNSGAGQRLLLSFNPCPGYNYTVEFRDALNDLAGWRSLPGAPHNSGSVLATNSNSQRFFRVNSSPIVSLSDLRLNIAAIPGGPGQRFLLTYPTVSAYNYTIEFRNDWVASTPWQALPGAPHNSGTVTVTNTVSPRFFRLRANPI